MSSSVFSFFVVRFSLWNCFLCIVVCFHISPPIQVGVVRFSLVPLLLLLLRSSSPTSPPTRQLRSSVACVACPPSARNSKASSPLPASSGRGLHVLPALPLQEIVRPASPLPASSDRAIYPQSLEKLEFQKIPKSKNPEIQISAKQI